jgi:hypothetical protein
MWVERSPEELANWQKRAEKEARSHGIWIGISAWAVSTLVLSAGWVVSFSTGIAIQRGMAGTFLIRLPVFALLLSPIIFIASRVERRKALRKAQLGTICPECDTAAEGNAAAKCACGGAFVPVSTVRWVE